MMNFINTNINRLFRLFLAFNSTLLFVVIYLIKSEINLIQKAICSFEYCHINEWSVENWVAYSSYILLVVFLTWISLFCVKGLETDNIEQGNVISIESANNSFLPSYLGYFFVALDIPNVEVLIFAYIIILAFIFMSQALYFNPVFLLFGYHFYYITTRNSIKVFLITKQDLKQPNNAEFSSLYRVNNHTFIEKK